MEVWEPMGSGSPWTRWWQCGWPKSANYIGSKRQMKIWDAFRGHLDRRDSFFSVNIIGKFFTTVLYPKAQTQICEETASPK